MRRIKNVMGNVKYSAEKLKQEPQGSSYGSDISLRSKAEIRYVPTWSHVIIYVAPAGRPGVEVEAGVRAGSSLSCSTLTLLQTLEEHCEAKLQQRGRATESRPSFRTM